MPRGIPTDPSSYRDQRRGRRLQRVLADAGVAARRACERLVEDGRVKINGRIVTDLPAWVDPETDDIRVDGKRVETKARHIYVLLNKPKRTITTTSDEPDLDRRTVVDLVDHPAASRLFPVGRLDFDTVGMLLLTNDGWLANRLTHPRFGVVKTYHAVVRGNLSDDDVARLADGIYLAERKAGQTVGASRTARVGIRVHRRDRDRTTLELTLKEGRNRQVRRMLAAVGCPVKKLERVAMGPVRMKGLPRGAWRELDRREIDQLRRAVTGRGPTELNRPAARAPLPGSNALSDKVIRRAARSRANPAGFRRPNPATGADTDSGADPGPDHGRDPGHDARRDDDRSAGRSSGRNGGRGAPR
ncbi:MAG: pseudouridine synthase [Planctomycetota bacterium]